MEKLNNMYAKIRADYVTAIKTKNAISKTTLSLLLNEIENSAKVKKDILTDEEISKLISREVKKREQSIRMYESGGRAELVEKETMEKDILMTYLPAPLTEDELRYLIEQIKSENPDVIEGKLIGMVNKAANGRNPIPQIKKLLS